MQATFIWYPDRLGLVMEMAGWKPLKAMTLKQQHWGSSYAQ
ncbi:hypothetical protein SBDP1_10046 [Syntrophobacter sp. SbD1]|nr:hypothetical protein SBDP1_10046 [Syntrophobacter sp. SbD1]